MLSFTFYIESDWKQKPSVFFYKSQKAWKLIYILNIKHYDVTEKDYFPEISLFMHAHHCRMDLSLTICFRDFTRPPTLHKIITGRNQFINTFDNWTKRMGDIQVYALQHFFARSLIKGHVRFNILLQSTTGEDNII